MRMILWRAAYWTVLAAELILIRLGGWMLDMGEDLEDAMERIKARTPRV